MCFFWGGGGFSFHCERFKGLVIHAVNMSANSGVIRWFDVMGKGRDVGVEVIKRLSSNVREKNTNCILITNICRLKNVK